MATRDNREERRRRIVEQGSDRLAFIKGRIQTLSPSSSPKGSYHSHTTSSPPSVSLHHDLSDQPSSVGKDRVHRSLLSKHDYGSESAELNSNGGGGGEGPFMSTSSKAFRSSSLDFDGRVQPSLVSSEVQNSSISTSDTERHFEPKSLHRKLFTPSQISSAIAATERNRISCSLAAAVLVVLSYVGFPVLGSCFIKSIILSRPLYLLLLTNISIVLARLLLEKPRDLERAEQRRNTVPPASENGLADQVGKALNSGLVLQNMIGALFMDCSVYATGVICGLSLAGRLGW